MIDYSYNRAGGSTKIMVRPQVLNCACAKKQCVWYNFNSGSAMDIAQVAPQPLYNVSTVHINIRCSKLYTKSKVPYLYMHIVSGRCYCSKTSGYTAT